LIILVSKDQKPPNDPNPLFQKKLHEFVGEVQTTLPTENIERNLNNWNGHLFFMDRKKCLVFVNNLTIKNKGSGENRNNWTSAMDNFLEGIVNF